MGFFTKLFGEKKSIQSEIVLDTKKMRDLWKDYRASYDKKIRLIEKPWFRYVESKRLSVLNQLERLITEELRDIELEKKTNAQLRADLHLLLSDKWKDNLPYTALTPDNDEAIIKWLQKLFEILQAELRLVTLLKKDPLLGKLSKGGWDLLVIPMGPKAELERIKKETYVMEVVGSLDTLVRNQEYSICFILDRIFKK